MVFEKQKPHLAGHSPKIVLSLTQTFPNLPFQASECNKQKYVICFGMLWNGWSGGTMQGYHSRTLGNFELLFWSSGFGGVFVVVELRLLIKKSASWKGLNILINFNQTFIQYWPHSMDYSTWNEVTDWRTPLITQWAQWGIFGEKVWVGKEKRNLHPIILRLL